MKKFIQILSVFLIITAFIPKNKTSEDIQKIKTNIQGSWELVSYIDHQNNGSDWTEYGKEIIYQKHITDNHFAWIKYDKSENQLLGMGGGSYIIDDEGKYVEYLEFFYPPGSSELGQAIPFDVKFDKGKWYHTGKAKEMEMTEQGEMEVVGYNKIEEVWSPITPINNNKDELIGTWDLGSYRENVDGPYLEYPVFTGYMKLITPTHFIWIKYDREGDQIFQAGSGPYIYDGKKYVEKVNVLYPANDYHIDTDVVFVPKVNDYKWEHVGMMAPVEEGEDSTLIDEIWVPHVCDPDSELSFSY